VDLVAYPLPQALALLDNQQLKYVITRTQPIQKNMTVQEDCLYVVRQTLDYEGIYHLAVAAKMGKEVF